MKRILVNILLACLPMVGASAYDFVMDGIYYNINDDGMSVSVTYKTTSYDSYSGEVAIPSTVMFGEINYQVTGIGTYAFYACSNLSAVTIPNSVVDIGSSAFMGCGRLANITIPVGVMTIGKNAFYGCYSLTSVTIPEGVTNIGEDAFEGCYSLTSVTIPESVVSIGRGAFEFCI